MGFFEFLWNNIATVAVLLVLCAVVGAVIFFTVRKKRAGGCCSSGCSGCPLSGKCHEIGGGCGCKKPQAPYGAGLSDTVSDKREG